jgi:threonine/homoserine/homoserine lactone efflux protein
MTFVEWLSLALVCLMGAVSPGPSVLVVVNQTLNGSRLNGVVTAISHGLMVGVWALVTVLGISQLLLHIPFLQIVLSIFAVIYLLYLAQGAWRGGKMQISTQCTQSTKSLASAVSDGAAIALFNPKLALFFLALFTPFVDAERGFSEQYLLVLTPWATDTLWYLVVAMLLSRPASLAWLEQRQRVINRVLALALVLIAALLLIGLA